MAAPLAALLPAKGSRLSADEVLDRFVTYVSGTGLTLYPAQEEAILELLGGKHVVLATPTGSGKSLVALALHFMAMAEGKTSFYTCPIKALVNEKFFALCDAFGAEAVGMMTGDAAINRDAPILCCTAEILSNLSIRQQRQFADVVVMDEFHYYGDKDRGVAWQVPLLSLPDTQFLLMSATLGDTSAIAQSVFDITKREVVEVRSAQRPVPLEFRYAESPLHETVQDLLHENRAPIYLVNFTQRSAAEQAQNLMSVDVCTKEEKQKLKEALAGARFDTPFGKDLKRLLLHGLGLHHAGLLPKYRRTVERLSQQGMLKVISGTDTLGVGVNIPIRTVLFTQLCKFDGEKSIILPVRDFQQIAGRAGRKGFDDQGYVVAQAPAHVIENARLAQKKAEGKRNVTLQKPPQKGYVHWDKSTFERLTVSQPEKLESRFTVTHALLVNLLQAYQDASTSGYRRLVELVALSHTSAVIKGRLLKHARALFRSLVGAGVVQVAKKTPTMPAHVKVAEGLQKEFSLNHTLSLFLLEVLPKLDPTLETYAVDVLTLVESILESPDAVLYAQRDRAKDEKIRELKAQGVEYEQRMIELEKVDYPKPNAEFIYGTFDEFAAKHPWVGHENIRPKAVARELFEKCQTFNEFVKEYGVQRSEGVLLRYLSDVYKTVVQNVPESARTEALEDIAAYLLTTLKHTDSSLLEEWEAMRYGRQLGLVVKPGEEAPRPRRDLAKDEKGLKARVRAELHQLVRLLAKKDYEEVMEQLPPESELLDAKALEAALAPYWAEHPSLDVTPRARQPVLTQLSLVEPRLWTVRHALIDPKGEQDWYLEGVVDLRGREDVDGALVALRSIRK
ncbi:MAG: DEAD/DEAH box helicase [Myxococcaceae bacterium]